MIKEDNNSNNDHNVLRKDFSCPPTNKNNDNVEYTVVQSRKAHQINY